MRTNIIVNDRLMKQAMQLSGLHTKKSVVEESLKLFVQMQKQKKLSAWFRIRGRQKSGQPLPQPDRLLALAGSISDEDANGMMRVIYEDRSADWDART